MITIRVSPVRQWFGKSRKRRQYRFEIVAGNGRRIDPRDTYANPGDIVEILTELISGKEPVQIVRLDTGGHVAEWQQIR